VNGLQATRTIRGSEAGTGRRTAIIGITAHVGRETVVNCLDAGMDLVLSKPLKLEDLYAAIDHCLELKVQSR
jgi:CheY-like chemotaxis protein